MYVWISMSILLVGGFTLLGLGRLDFWLDTFLSYRRDYWFCTRRFGKISIRQEQKV